MDRETKAAEWLAAYINTQVYLWTEGKLRT